MAHKGDNLSLRKRGGINDRKFEICVLKASLSSESSWNERRNRGNILK